MTCVKCSKKMYQVEVVDDRYDPSEPYGHTQTTETIWECDCGYQEPMENNYGE